MTDTLNDTESGDDQQPPKKLSVQDFAAKIKSKYPDYAGIDDNVLVQKMLDKYPVYKDQIDFGNVKKNASEPSISSDGKLQSKESNQAVNPVAADNSGSEDSFASQNPIDLAQQAAQLSTKSKVVNTPSMTGGFGMGTTSSSSVPDENALKESKKINDYLKGQKIDPKEVGRVFGDFPQEAYDYTLPDGTKPQSKDQLFKEWQANPIDTENKINNIKTQFALKNAGNDQAGNLFMTLQGTPVSTIQQYADKVQKQQQIIGENLTGEQRDKALQRLQATSSPNINSQTVMPEYEQSDLKGSVSPSEFAGLETLKLFDPSKYDQAVDILKTNVKATYDVPTNVPTGTLSGGAPIPATFQSADSTKGGRLSQQTIDQQIAQETVHRQLLSIGRDNELTQLNAKQYALNSQYEQTEDPDKKGQIQGQYLTNQQRINDIKKDAASDDDKFPLTANLKFDNEVKDITGQAGQGIVQYGTERFSKGFFNTKNSVQDMLVGLFGSKEDNTNLAMQRMGESQTLESALHLPDNLTSSGNDYVLQASKLLKDKADAILQGRNLSDLSTEEQGKLKDLVAQNPSQITTVANADKSKNFFSKSTAYSTAGFTGDILSFMAQTFGLSKLGLGAKAAEATTLFNSAYSDAYNEAVSEGDSPSIANQKAAVTGGIMSLAGIVSSKYDVVKSMLGGGKSPLSKEIAGVSEETWNNIVNKNKSLISKIGNSASSVFKDNAKMIATYGVGTTIAQDLAKNALFNSNISYDDMVNHAAQSAKDMAIGSAALMGVGFLTHAIKNPVTLLDKSNLWEAASNPGIAKSKIDEAVGSGQINQEQSNQRKAVVDKLSQLMQAIPEKDKKGELLSDEQKVRYLYNQFVKDKLSQNDELTDSKKEKAEALVGEADAENNKIVSGNEKENKIPDTQEEAGTTNEFSDEQKNEYTKRGFELNDNGIWVHKDTHPVIKKLLNSWLGKIFAANGGTHAGSIDKEGSGIAGSYGNFNFKTGKQRFLDLVFGKDKTEGDYAQTMLHELGHGIFDNLTDEEKGIIEKNKNLTQSAETHKNYRESGGTRKNSASDAEESFSDYVSSFLAKKIFGIEGEDYKSIPKEILPILEKNVNVPETEFTTNEAVSENSATAKEGSLTEKESELLKPHENSPVFMGMETPEQKLKYIADQAQNVNDKGEKDVSGVNAEPIMRKTFGNDLVDAAIEKYPAPKEQQPIVNSNSDYEAKKADIEKRRQDALDAQNFQRETKVETYEGTDDEGKKEIFRIITTKDGKKRIESEDGHILNKGFPKEVANEKLLEFTDNPNLIKTEDISERKIDGKINAKYDKELADLEIPKSENKPTISKEQSIPDKVRNLKSENHQVYYNGKVVDMGYIKNPKEQFRYSAQRISDNLGTGGHTEDVGYVKTPNGEIYKVSTGSKSAKPLEGEKLKEAQDKFLPKENIPDKVQEDKTIEPKKDLAQRAREEAQKFREGKKNVLPSFLRASLPEGTKKAGVDINIAWANALEAFANVHDATKDFAKAVEAGYKHLKDWFEENKVPFDGNKLKSDFENEMKGAAKTEKPEAKAAEKVEPEPPKSGNGGGEKPPSEGEGKSSEGEPSKVGVSHAALTKMSEELGTEAPQRGKRLSIEEYANIGRKLLNSGADVEKVEADFKAGKQPTVEDISIARAHLEDLHEITNAMGDKWGRDSSQYKKALAEEQRFVSEVVKPMGTKISEPFTALQGERDINTGSFTSLARVREENKGEPLTEVENQKAKELSEQVTVLSKEVEDLKNKLTDLLDKGKNVEETKKTLTEKAKNLADKFRKLKTKPFKFKDENGNDIDITKAGISWNDLVEFGAKAIEKTGEIADGVKVIIDKIKDEEWFVKLSNNDKQKFADDLYNHLDSEVPDILTKYVDKKGNKFTSEEAKEIWDYAKDNYLDKGKDFDQMINGTAADLGLKPEQVRDALITPKGAKQVTDEMYKKQIDRNKAVQRAKDWAKAEKVNPFVKALKSIPRFFFAAKVFGHGTVGMITHAGVNLFDPVEWKRYWPVFFKQFKFAYGSEIRYEKAMQDLQNDAQYLFWKRAGLAVDPSTRYDDYQFISRIFEKMGKVGRALTAGDRGFNALKVYRLERAKAIWNGLSEAEKADRETPRTIAELVNHSTGTTNLKVSNTANTVFFAPNLELSRWNKLIVDPSKAVKTLTEWNIATPAEKARAKLVGARAARIFGSFIGALAVNQALLSLSGSNQKINFTDPTSSDWLKFKAGGRTIDATGGVISLLGFLVRLGAIPFSDSKKSKKDAVMQQTWNYASGKLSPFASTAKDALTHHDFQGNTLPFFNDKPLHSWNKKLSLSEYLTQQQTPIPVAEYFHDLETQMEKQGVHKAAASDIIKSIFVAAMVGGTGAHIGEEPMTKRAQFTDEDLKDPAFKYYLDKGLSLPETSLTSEVVTDEKRKNKFSVSDQPKEIQDKYAAVHKEQLRKELAGFLKRRVVFVKTYTKKGGSEESTVYKDRPDGSAKMRTVNSLSQDELKQVLSMAQRMATKDAKKIVFKQK